MANVAVVRTNDDDVEGLSYLTFVDTDTGDVQKHAVNEAPAIADTRLIGVDDTAPLHFCGYVPGLGAVYTAVYIPGGEPVTSYRTAIYILNIGANEDERPDGVFTRTLIATGDATGAEGVGVDATGVYGIPGAAIGTSSEVNVLCRFGYDGSIAKITIGQYRFTRGSYCPMLWRGPTGFRAFIQQGPNFTSNLRGATEQFNFIPGSIVQVDIDMARTTTTAGFARGPEFSGFFYGYQPMNVDDAAPAYAKQFSGATAGLTWSGVDAAGGTLKSVGYSGNASAVYQMNSTVSPSGSSYFVSNTELGQIIAGDNTDNFPSGYVGDLPPYSKAGAFWTDLVYCLEIQ